MAENEKTSDSSTKYSAKYPTHLGDAEGPSGAVSTEPQGLPAPRAEIKRPPKSGPGGYNGFPD